MQFDHAGIATEDAETLAALFVDLFDTEVVHRETFDGLDVRFLDLKGGYFELLEPVEPDGPIARYLERNGPGIHHVAVATEDAAAALERARDHGVEPIDEQPRPGAWEHDVAFLHPKDTGGVLIEFVEH